MLSNVKVFENHPKSRIYHCASEASYVYILSGQKVIKKAKNGPFWQVFENLKLAVRSGSVTRQGTFNKTNIDGKCDILSVFQTL